MGKIGKIEFDDFPLLLAPMEDVSDPPFRALCKENGADIVTVGTEMDVYVVKIDKENLKIALSLKRRTPDTWEIIKDELVVGRKIIAKVTKITTFGAFVRTEQGVEGLVHVSEISHQELGSVEDIESVINVGQSLDLTIVNVDTERKRLGLSLISSAKPEENEEVQVAAESEDSESSVEENSVSITGQILLSR